MSYSIIGIIAIMVHLIINRDMLWHYSDYTDVPAYKEYREYILGMLFFCVADVLWGFLNDLRLVVPLYAVTVIYFITMMAGFLLWTRYVAAYMEGDGHSLFRRILFVIGIVLFCCEIVILIINFFVPIQFYYDEKAVYHAGGARYVTLAMQVVLFLATSVYTFAIKPSNESAIRRLRRSVGLFGVLMAALIILQLFYPMLPLYSIGYLLSSCMLHSFVVEEEKDEYRKNLQEMLDRTRQQSLELGDARRKIYTDPLTGVGSKQAYLEDVDALDTLIRDDKTEDFGVIVIDLNDLKIINDTLGHDTGDIYIYNAAMLISEFFDRCPVYRIGGDEFAVILQGESYQSRNEHLAAFETQIDSNLRTDKVVISSGMSEYNRGADTCYLSVFERADQKMYRRKRRLKRMNGSLSRQTLPQTGVKSAVKM